jgi:uncharacterized protein HemX
MRTWVGFSQSVPVDALLLLGGVAAVGYGAWFVVKAMQDGSEQEQLVRLRGEQEHEIRRLEAKRDQSVQERDRLRIQEIAALEVENARQRTRLEEIQAQLAEHLQASIEQWRQELGESATNVRLNGLLICPHCQVKGEVLVANSNAGKTLARCMNCASDWSF